MEPNQKRVLEFHRAFDQPAPMKFTPMRDADLLQLRARLILEEALEFCAAADIVVTSERGYGPIKSIVDLDLRIASKNDERGEWSPDDVEMIDALCDLHYVIDGAAVCMGVDLEPFNTEVHRSNMSKLGADGRPVLREGGKVMKGPSYTPPNIAGMLAALVSR